MIVPHGAVPAPSRCPTTIAAALADAAAALASAGLDEPRRHARRLLAAALGLTPTEVFAHPGRALGSGELAAIAAMQCRLAAREPLSRVLGKREFWGLEFALSADTLDPRPESETLVEAVLALLPKRDRPYRLLDLGTGTGCLLLALLSEYRAARGVGVDVAAGAARTARANAERLGLGARARFVVGDWGAALDAGFDAIVANPPYIASAAIAGLPREVHDHDPQRALDGGRDGLSAYRAIAAELPRLLRHGGYFVAEVGSAAQADEVTAILARCGLDVVKRPRDLAGIVRGVVARR